MANNTTPNVNQLLLAVNKKAKSGVLYVGDATLQAQAADLFNYLDQAGSIGWLSAGSRRHRTTGPCCPGLGARRSLQPGPDGPRSFSG
jgi:hypothetical protein